MAHDPKKLNDTLETVNDALNDLELNHKSKRFVDCFFVFVDKIIQFTDDQYYVDSYGSGLLLRGVLLHFLHRYDEAHQSFDTILQMFVIIA